jgi:trimethylamine corrinoid protein
MSKQDILVQIKQGVFDLDGDKVNELLKKGLDAGLSPMEMITDGMNPALSEIGDEFEKNLRFMSDLVLAGEIMNDSMAILEPAMVKGGKSSDEVMVIGTVEGDQHYIGKRIVAAMFTGVGYKVIDIGENCSGDQYVEAIKKNKPVIVGASAILGPVKSYCGVINQAMEDAGLREKVIYIIGGWGMTQEWADNVGADAFGLNAVEAIHKVKMLRAGEMKKLKDRVKKK